MKLEPYVRLFRIDHAIMLSVAVFLAIGISTNGKFDIPIELILASLSVPFFVEMGSFALNDYFDVKVDKENKRTDRPIAQGEISPKDALWLSLFFYFVALIISVLFLPFIANLIVFIFSALSILYNYKLKEFALIGNLYIAFSMGIPFIFGNLIVSPQILSSIFSISLVSVIAGLGREIVKTVQDFEGDLKHRSAHTLPKFIGKKSSLQLASLLFFLLFPLSFIPFFVGLKINILSLGLVFLSASSFFQIGLILLKENLEKIRSASLFSLQIGLIGYALSLI
jgi:geranylgeranylglycerol-phosphate geranylgeranyltransferase